MLLLLCRQSINHTGWSNVQHIPLWISIQFRSLKYGWLSDSEEVGRGRIPPVLSSQSLSNNLLCSNNCTWAEHVTLTFTFMYLADTFIQSDTYSAFRLYIYCQYVHWNSNMWTKNKTTNINRAQENKTMQLMASCDKLSDTFLLWAWYFLIQTTFVKYKITLIGQIQEVKKLFNFLPTWRHILLYKYFFKYTTHIIKKKKKKKDCSHCSVLLTVSLRHWN